MQQIQVQVENDHIERITSAKPLAAISELIWNAYDADASYVKVLIQPGSLTEIDSIVVEDNGKAFAHEDAESFFQSLGGSWKKKGNKHKTEGGRSIHGEKGQGRFKAFALGGSVTWTSGHNGQEFSVSGHKFNLKNFTITTPAPSDFRGCSVRIENVPKDFQISKKYGFQDQIRDCFALQLYDDPNFKIIYDGIEIDANKAISEITPYEIEIKVEDGTKHKGTLRIVEWRRKVDRSLMLCLPGGFSFHAMPPAIQARGFNFTAYLSADIFRQLVDENREALVELNPNSNTLIDEAKECMRKHFRAKESRHFRRKIDEWKQAKLYPYEGETTDPLEQSERQVFDVVALNLADYSSDFDKSTDKQKRLILRLVRTAVESEPGDLPDILEQVIGLPKERQEDLADLLRKTSLVNVINSAKSVTNRLDFLKGLEILLFDTKSKIQLLERTQLHRILAQETWIFGEEFNLVNDDEDLSSVLKSHFKLLGQADDNGVARSEIDTNAPVLDTEGRKAIVDLMLSARVPAPTDDKRKHLVVELKRPSQKINWDVIAQIERYALAVANDPRFINTGVEWDFVAVSNEMTPEAISKANQSDRPSGLVHSQENPQIRVWIKTWSEIINEAKGRLTFYRRGLQYQANDDESLKYLKYIRKEYLSDEILKRINEVEATENQTCG